MLPLHQVSNPGPLALVSDGLPTVLCSLATNVSYNRIYYTTSKNGIYAASNLHIIKMPRR